MSDIPSNTYLKKIVAYVKPEQSGKTFEMIESIINNRKNNIDSNIIPIDIIITDLNITLVNQTINRVKEKLYYSNEDNKYLQDLFKNHSFISFNSKDKKYKNKKDVLSELRDDYNYLIKNYDSDSDTESESDANKNGTIISCCRHEQRWKDLFGNNDFKESIVYRLNSLRGSGYKFKFTIWCDEFDTYITNINKYIEPLMNRNSIDISVNGLSATIEKVYKVYDTFQIVPLERTYIQELYHKWDDNKIFEEEQKPTIYDFTKFILDKYYDKSNIGEKWFIPAKNCLKSHQTICDICLLKGMCVFVKNSKGLLLHRPKYKSLKLTETLKNTDGSNISFSELLGRAINDYNLHNYQIAVTGCKCIGRGVTIQYNEFLFDNAILYDISDESTLSQMGGRLNGNLKTQENYDPEASINVYTTTKFNKKMRKMRYISENLAKMAYDKDKNNPSFITKTEYKELKRKCDTNNRTQEADREPIIFKCKTQEQLKEYFYQNKNRLGGGTGPQKRKPLTEGEHCGKFTANLNKSGGTRVATWDEIYAIRKHGLNNTHKYYVYPCYQDINDITTLEFWMIHY